MNRKLREILALGTNYLNFSKLLSSAWLLSCSKVVPINIIDFYCEFALSMRMSQVKCFDE